MKKLLIISIIGLFLGVTLIPVYTARSLEMNSASITNSNYFNGWEYDNETGGWIIIFDADLVNKSIEWKSDITNSPRAMLEFTYMYNFEDYSYFDEETEYLFNYQASGYLELSLDEGSTWIILDTFNGHSVGIIDESYDISSYGDTSVIIRFRVEGIGDKYFKEKLGGYWLFWDIMVKGMGDDIPPGTIIDYSINKASLLVTFHVCGVDNESGVREVHFIHNGIESVGINEIFYTTEVRIEHSITFWSIDIAGNEATHHTVPSFRIDNGTPPNVTIIGPEPGFYLFGNKILDINKIIIIVGAFTIEADAYDEESGVCKVAFYLNGDLIGESTSAPYSAYCAIKNEGFANITVIAEDFSMNTAEDTKDLYYYKLL